MPFKKLCLLLTTTLFSLIFWYYILISNAKYLVSDKPTVVCTTTIIADAIKNIAKDTIILNILMGPGVDPHLYKPIEQNVITITNAQLIFYNGLHLEARMADLFAHMQKNKTIAVTKDMPKNLLLYSKDFTDFADPHVWFDPILWIYAIKTITQALQELSPAHAIMYENNKNDYITLIEQTYRITHQMMQKIPKSQRFLITGHDAFSYFARAYDCMVVSLQGISTASEAGTRDVQNLINFIITHKIPTVFAESCIPVRNMQALIQGVTAQGWQIKLGNELLSDALGSPNTPEESYCGMLTSNVENISKGLNSINVLQQC